MADDDCRNARGNKAKTSSGWKHGHQELTVVRFLPFVGEDGGRNGVVTGEADLQCAWYGRPTIFQLPAPRWLRDDKRRW
jgi:hypothetical protein